MDAVSKLKINDLQNQLSAFERKYSQSTSDFLSEFESGKAGDKEDFFKWFAYAMALKDWQTAKYNTDK